MLSWAIAPQEEQRHGALPEADRGKLDAALSPTGNGLGRLRGLDLARVLRARARGHLQEDLAQRGPGGGDPPHRPVLHQGAPVRGHLGDHRAGQGGRGARVPQHLPAPGQQAGLERLSGRGDQRGLSPVHLQVPRMALRPRRLADLRPAGVGVLRSRQGGLRARPGADRGLGGLHLRQPRPRQHHLGQGVPRWSRGRHRGLPVRRDDPGLQVPGQRSAATGSCSSTPSPSSTMRPSCTRSRPPTTSRASCRATGSRHSPTPSTGPTAWSRRGGACRPPRT